MGLSSNQSIGKNIYEKYGFIPDKSSSNINEINSDQIDSSTPDYSKYGFVPENEGLGTTTRDIGEQIGAKGFAGALGSYGNLLETFGLQLNPNEMLPGQQAISPIQQNIIEKMNRGEAPTYGEMMILAGEEGLPSGYRLPTSREVQSGIENITGIGEAKTPLGRIAGRGAEFGGETLALPGGGARTAMYGAGAGIAGQGLREAGAPEYAATGTEIAGSLLPSGISKRVAPRSSSAQILAEGGRKLGLSEKQLAPLMHSEKKLATLSNIAKKGEKTKNVLASVKEKLGDSYSNIKESLAKSGKVSPLIQKETTQKFQKIRNDLGKTLHPSTDKEAAIKFIDSAIEKMDKTGATPEELINFWQDINKSVRWNSIQGGKKSLSRLKEPIMSALNKVDPLAAKDFEMTNQLYSKYAQVAKRLKPGIIDTFISKAEILGIPSAGFALVEGNPWVLGGLASEAGLRTLAREMIINPYFQNISNKLVKNFNSGSVKAIKDLTNQASEYMTRKYPDEDWEFLKE